MHWIQRYWLSSSCESSITAEFEEVAQFEDGGAAYGAGQSSAADEAGTIDSADMNSSVEIDAISLETRGLNDLLKDMMLAGKKRVSIRNVCGQRYIGTRLFL